MRLNKKANVIAAQKNVLKREVLKDKAVVALEKANARLEKAIAAISPEEALEFAGELNKAIEVKSGTFGGAGVTSDELVEIQKEQ